MVAPPNCNGANTTECILLTATAILDKVERLLQETEKTNSSFDWDPASFAVTFIIGLVALFFALLTIVQGLYAAGPGRLKCSRYPIGTWAAHQFYPSELRFRSVAYTPIISIDELLRRSWPDESNWVRLNNKGDEDFEYQSNSKEHNLLPYYPKDVAEEYPATWLAILATCGLDHPKWWKSKPQSPDYLPSEFTATPAFSSIHDLISLVALSSCCGLVGGSIEIDFDEETKLPFMRSTYSGSALFDLDFRRHPVLGLYGVVQVSRDAFYGIKTRGWASKCSPEDHCRLETDETATLLYTKGYIPTRPPLVNRRPRDFGKLGSIIDQYRSHLMDLQYACKADTVGCCTVGPACWLSYHDEIFKIAPSSQSGFPMDVKDYASLSLLAAEQVARAVLFPWRTSGLLQGLQSLLVLSRFWCLGEAINTTPGPRNSDGHNATDSRQPTCVDPISFGEFQPKKGVFLHCLHFLRDDLAVLNGREEISTPKNPPTTVNILREIGLIDKFLLSTGQNTVACRILALHYSANLCSYIAQSLAYNNAQNEAKPAPNDFGGLPRLSSAIMAPFILQILDADLESLLNRDDFKSNMLASLLDDENRRNLVDKLSRIKKIWEFDQDKETFTYPSEDVQYWIDDLLIYRAILVAMVLRLYAVDNSEIITNPVYRKLIPVL